MSFKSERDEFIEKIPVSHETAAKLDRYAELLVEWNQKFNMVAESTLPHIWNRHFLDSAQLFNFIPKTAKSMADMGSGAGFPGVVLSIMGAPTMYLIEATGKKANFLRTVVEELKINAVVRQERAEEIRDLRVDVITARAVAPLTELLKLSNRLILNDSRYLFLKGQKAADELTESAKYWTFKHEKRASISDPSGSVLILRDVTHRSSKTGKPSRSVLKGKP